MIESYGISDIGCVREDNEDRILMDHSLGLFLVADGMGGQQHGEIAAELAISTLRYYIDSSRDRFDVTWPFGYSFDLSIDANRLNTGIKLAGRQVWRHAEQGPQYSGMGTTLAALLLNDSEAVVGNVGDSRVYLYREGKLAQLSRDDTWIASLTAADRLKSEEATNHPMRNVLTQAIGSQEDIDVHICEQSLRTGDLLLLTSDGLHTIVEESEICSMLEHCPDVQGAVERLVESAMRSDAPDNVSIVILGYHR